jgi:hypothetical protein
MRLFNREEESRAAMNGNELGMSSNKAAGDPQLLISSPSSGDTAAWRVWLLVNGYRNIART